MLFTRWKMLTGAIGLSIGGIATYGGTKPPAESPMMVRADQKETIPPPPSVTAPSAPAVTPVLPSLPPTPVSSPMPVLPPSSPVVELPGLPLPESKPTETKLPPATKPAKPMDLAVLPVSGVVPALPPMDVPPAANLPTTPAVSLAPVTPPTTSVAPPALPTTPPAPEKIGANLIPPTSTKPVAITPVEPSLPPPTEFVAPSVPPMPKPSPLPAAEVPTAKPAPATVAATVPSKFRIVLRVGAGEPSFEVRHEDDLVMKVVCEKVDIKSPEKGQGPSNVTATGKVRFVGFGAEGTCDSFSFLAGTGEVSLTGNVNVKVRDKIGRVESELNAEKMQYKLDPTALAGVLKP